METGYVYPEAENPGEVNSFWTYKGLEKWSRELVKGGKNPKGILYWDVESSWASLDS